MERLDLARASFRAFVYDGLPRGAAVYLKVHHALADGIVFQDILHRLSDAEPAVAARMADAVLPDAATWRAIADARLAASAGQSAAH